jgi:ATP-dependent DNA helicase PIF1
VDPELVHIASSLNPEQRYDYNEILLTIETGNGGVFFLDGPGGTGKTYLYKALLAKVRSEGKTSGVASSILPGGRTAHSRFKIPLNIEDNGVCSFTKQSGTTKLLTSASLIIWDEVSMTKRQTVEALDSSMRDTTGRHDVPFGGKTIVFGGDFRQVLPVIRKGTRSQITYAMLRKLYLWDSMQQLRLVHNMRAEGDPWFAEYILRVGNGTEETVDDGCVRLPDVICIPYTGSDSNINLLIESVFPMLDENLSDPNYITCRAILCCTCDLHTMRQANAILHMNQRIKIKLPKCPGFEFKPRMSITNHISNQCTDHLVSH